MSGNYSDSSPDITEEDPNFNIKITDSEPKTTPVVTRT
jgi:hypothetical protein